MPANPDQEPDMSDYNDPRPRDPIDPRGAVSLAFKRLGCRLSRMRRSRAIWLDF